MTKRFNRFFEICFFTLLIALLTLLATGKFAYAVEDGLKLWLAVIVPSLFPYFFITVILSSLKITGKLSSRLTPITKRLFNVNGSVGYAYFLSVVSGYPVGAKTVADLYSGGVLNQTESVRAAALCSTSCPVFLIGSVGSVMFSSPIFGIKLFVVHVLASILVGVIFSFYKRADKPNKTASLSFDKKVDNIFYDGVYDSVISVLVIGGIITLFYLATQILITFNILTPLISLLTPVFGDLSSGVVFGLFECTTGLKQIAGSSAFLSLPVCALITGFGGISVIVQSTSALKKAKIKTAPFLFAKVLQAVISFGFGILAVTLFP